MNLYPDPFGLFFDWFGEAKSAEAVDPHIVALATASRDGAPSVRMVILRIVNQSGFVFFTDAESPKAQDLAVNPRAALVFHWSATRRQVRATGRVDRVRQEETARYFAERPRDAQVAAWIRQSRVAESRAEVEARFAALETQYAGRDVPLPPFLGGFRLTPDTCEFWEQRESRLHDRACYRRSPDGRWASVVLTP